MLDVASRVHRPQVLDRVTLLQTSALDINLPDGSMDLVFCMRLLHHIGEPADRLTILREFARVSTGHALVSLWVDGNYQAGRRHRLEARRSRRKYQNRFVLPAETFEQEARQAGFEIIRHVDLLPGISMWRTYVLKVRHGAGPAAVPAEAG